MKYVQKRCFKGKFVWAPSFLVWTRLTPCVRAHSVEGTLVLTYNVRHGSVLCLLQFTLHTTPLSSLLPKTALWCLLVIQSYSFFWLFTIQSVVIFLW